MRRDLKVRRSVKVLLQNPSFCVGAKGEARDSKLGVA